jgi:hypothetical protein
VGRNGLAGGFEQRKVTAELVDQVTDDALPVRLVEQQPGAHQRCHGAAAVEVADHHDRDVGAFGEVHVGDVAVAQIDLGAAARSFDEHQVGLRAESLEAVQHGRHQLLPHPVIGSRGAVSQHPSAQHDLTPGAGLRLQQDGIHVDGRRYAAGECLQGLSSPDLTVHRLPVGSGPGIAVRGHGRVVAHVLCLERPHDQPASPKGPAQTGDEQTLADVRRRSLDHQGACAARATTVAQARQIDLEILDRHQPAFVSVRRAAQASCVCLAGRSCATFGGGASSTVGISGVGFPAVPSQT